MEWVIVVLLLVGAAIVWDYRRTGPKNEGRFTVSEEIVEETGADDGTSPGTLEGAPAPIIDDPTERGFERWFRRSGDDPHVYRINQKPPQGLQKKLLSYVEVAGISRGDRPEAVEGMLESSERHIELEREPDNPHDPNAVAVVAHWTEYGESRSKRIGYLPREAAAELAESFPEKDEIGATIETVFASREGKRPGLRIDVWGRRDKRTKPEPKPYDPEIEVPDDPLERNTQGRELEREGRVDNAIEFYRANVEDDFEGSFPYRRLAIIYRKRKEYDKEVAVLKEAVRVFEEVVLPQRADRDAKLEKFEKRLERARELADE